MADPGVWTPPAADAVQPKPWTPPATDAVLPSAEEALRQKEAIGVRNRVRQDKEQFVANNVQPGTKLDIGSGLPAGIRARLSAEPDIDKQVDLLSKQDGIISARKAKDGSNVIARIKADDGTEKEVLLHPLNKRLDIGAVAGEAVPLAKMGAATGLAMATSGASLPAQALIMGTTMGGLQAQQEITFRVLGGQDIDPIGIAKDVAIEGGLNAAIPGALAVGQKGAKLAQRALQGSGTLETAVPAAAKRLGITTLPSMDTGSKVLARAENAAGLAKQNAELTGGLKAAEDRQLGLSGAGGVPTEQQVADKVQPIAAKNALAATAGVDAAKTEAANAASNKIGAILDTGIVPSDLKQSEAGAFLRSKLESFAGKVKAEAEKNYPAFYEKAAEKGITLDSKPVSDLVAKISAEDPSGAAELLSPSIKQVKAVESKLNPGVIEGVDTGIVDARGNPIKTAPEAPPPLGFQEAINLRAIVRKKLAAGFDALGDPVKRYYAQLNNALTETIENGIKSDKSGELEKLYDTARGSYSEGAQALEQGKLPKLFADAGTAGHVPDENIVPSLFTGKGNLDGIKAWKSVLSPQEYALLRRQGVNYLTETAGTTGGYINADTFLSKLNSLSPEVRDELLGPVAKDLTSNAKLLAAARGKKIDPIDLEDALSSAPGDAPKLLKEAFAREAQADLQYNTGVQKALRDGTLSTRVGNIDKFTSTWLDQASASDARQAMTQIAAGSKEAAEMVRQRALQNILNDSRAANELGQITTGGNPAIDARKLAKFTTGVNREKYEAVLGKDGVQFLDDLGTVSESRARSIAQGQGKPLTAEADAERMAAAAEGNALTLARSGGRLALKAVLAIPGNAMRSQAVANYLKTGELPELSRTARTVLAAAPEDVKVGKKVLAEVR